MDVNVKCSVILISTPLHNVFLSVLVFLTFATMVQSVYFTGFNREVHPYFVKVVFSDYGVYLEAVNEV